MLLAEEATEAYEKTRDKIANFVNIKIVKKLSLLEELLKQSILLHMHGEDLTSKKATLLLLLNMNIIATLSHGSFLLKKKVQN